MQLKQSKITNISYNLCKYAQPPPRVTEDILYPFASIAESNADIEFTHDTYMYVNCWNKMSISQGLGQHLTYVLPYPCKSIGL